MAETFYGQIAANRRNSFLLVAGRRRPVRARSASRSATRSRGERDGRRRRHGDRARRRRRCCRSGRTSAATRSSSPRRARRRSTRQAAPQLLNVVQELAIAANVPMPKVYIIDDTAPERLRDRPRPAARVGRDHDRPPREARPRGAPGRDRPRAVARPQLRHPVRAARRRPRRVDRAPGRLLPAVHVLGRRSAGRSNRDTGGGGLQAIMFVVAIVLVDPRPDRRPARPARGQPPARVPRRRVVGRS